MSRLPFILTLVVCGAVFGWLFVNQDPPKNEKPRAKAKAKVRPVAAAPAPAAPAVSRIYGYPDPRGILLNLRERKGSCEGSRFRSQSPAFVLWDDGNIVSMSPTYDYRRSRVSIAQAESWSREFQSVAAGQTGIRCDVLRDRSARGDIISLQGRKGEGGELLLSGPNIALVDPSHVATCADCSTLAPMARLLGEIDQQRRQADQSRLPTEFPAEVYLEFRSCGCRNHPEIVKVSREWPLPGPKPEERCGRQSARFRLDDPAQIRLLSEAIANSAAVLDREEIYTCFMRPLLEIPTEGSIARR
jgi:hypothetical protein